MSVFVLLVSLGVCSSLEVVKLSGWMLFVGFASLRSTSARMSVIICVRFARKFLSGTMFVGGVGCEVSLMLIVVGGDLFLHNSLCRTCL